MATFRQPDPEKNAECAVETAVAILIATNRLNRESKELPLEVHIGISSGITLVGSTQFQGRHGTRWVFSASGRDVNIAARLASIAQSGQILISTATRNRLGKRYVMETQGSKKLKNIEEQIEAFQIMHKDS